MRKARFVLGALVALGAAAPLFGAPIYMKIEGVDGEAVGAPAPGSIEIEAAQIAEIERLVALKAPRGGQGIALQVSSLNFTKRTDKASPVLMKASAQGKHFNQAVITVRKAGGGSQDYLVLKLENVFVSSFQAGRAGSPTESLSLNFTKLLADYHPAVSSLPAVQHAPAVKR